LSERRGPFAIPLAKGVDL
jgi:hypothetical protein